MPGPAQTDQPPPEDTVARTTSGATPGRPGLTSRNYACGEQCGAASTSEPIYYQQVSRMNRGDDRPFQHSRTRHYITLEERSVCKKEWYCSGTVIESDSQGVEN